MCTVGDFDAALNLTPDDAMVNITHTDDNLNEPEIMFCNAYYSNSFHNISLKRKLYLLMIRIRCSIKHNKTYLLIKRLKFSKQIEYMFM